MKRAELTAKLFLNECDVGTVQVKGWDGAWGFGQFTPGAGFCAFAPRFGAWSLLMHADDGTDDPAHGRLSGAAAEELRAVEWDIDRIHARLYLARAHEWRDIVQLNIDGPLIEWKEGCSRGSVPHSA